MSLESILCTEELSRRPWRPPDYKKENHALVALASALADSPHSILQTLTETLLEVTQSDSSGVSLLMPDGKTFYWPAIAGVWKPHIGGRTPRNFGPCGDVLDRNISLLFQHIERRYTYFVPVTPLVEEGLLVPFYVGGKAVGTIWAVMHDDHRKFDAEDERLMSALGRFASLAYQTLASIDALKCQIAEREKAETAVRKLAEGLETKFESELKSWNSRTKKLRNCGISYKKRTSSCVRRSTKRPCSRKSSASRRRSAWYSPKCPESLRQMQPSLSPVRRVRARNSSHERSTNGRRAPLVRS